MDILAIETSTEYCSAALWQDGKVSERCELVGQKHSEVLMAMLDAVLQDSGFRISMASRSARGRDPLLGCVSLAASLKVWHSGPM